MRDVRVSDVTIKQFATAMHHSLSFKEKLEVAKLLDRLGASVIELECIQREKADSLLIKSVASVIEHSVLAVPVALDGSNVESTWAALAEAKNPRLQVEASVSPAQIEYVHRMKPATMKTSIVNTLSACAAKTNNVEFVAVDAGRSDMDYLTQVIDQAITAGATTVTVCDTAGKMLPSEFTQFIRDLYDAVPALHDVALGVSCANDFAMAEACALAGIMEGVAEVKTSTYPLCLVGTEKLARILRTKRDVVQAECSVRLIESERVSKQVCRICDNSGDKGAGSRYAAADPIDSVELTAQDSMEDVIECVKKLGYDLSPEDAHEVYEAFLRIASKKESVDSRELDAIVASAALQVPPTYELGNYLITSCNAIKSSVQIEMEKDGQLIQAVALGDGPIDAAFKAIEQIVGHHYELDDFQIQSVTEGQEAMGEAVIKLASGGKVYSGRGLSTNIISSSMRAYVNALNKIVYEEQN